MKKIVEAAIWMVSIIILVLLVFGGSGCSTHSAPGEAATVSSASKVAERTDKGWELTRPPALRFTGKTMSGNQARSLARVHGYQVEGLHDGAYAQIEAESAVEVALWLKRLMWDIGYDYRSESRDCDNFARAFRVLPDLFADDAGAAQAAVFGLAVKMSEPFAGVTDGYHALNIIWTDQGWFVFEPQGVDLVYQSYETWPNRGGILKVLGD